MPLYKVLMDDEGNELPDEEGSGEYITLNFDAAQPRLVAGSVREATHEEEINFGPARDAGVIERSGGAPTVGTGLDVTGGAIDETLNETSTGGDGASPTIAEPKAKKGRKAQEARAASDAALGRTGGDVGAGLTTQVSDRGENLGTTESGAGADPASAPQEQLNADETQAELKENGDPAFVASSGDISKA
jgi:hypothetical protein